MQLDLRYNVRLIPILWREPALAHHPLCGEVHNTLGPAIVEELANHVEVAVEIQLMKFKRALTSRIPPLGKISSIGLG